MAYIYKIQNLVNGNVYIGKTNQTIEARFRHHCNDRLKLECQKRPLYRAFAKYGIDNFAISVLEECNVETASDKEIYWIQFYDSYKNGYNATTGGDGKSSLPREEIVLKYLECQSVKETAEQFGCHRGSVFYVLKEAKVDTVKKLGEDRHDVKLTESDVVNIVKLYVPGKFGKRKIAKALDLPLEPVNSVLRGSSWQHLH